MSRRASVNHRPSLGAITIAFASLFAVSCGDEPNREPALAEAFVAPATLQVRAELVARSKLVTTLKHGDRVEIIGRRRRFYKLRTSSGAVGWADSWQLMSTAGMEHLRDLARQTAEAPSQGQATAYDSLNVHTAPNRQAPTIFQLTPGIKVEVIAHQKTPRVPYRPPAPLLPSFESEKASARKAKREPKDPPPPRPAAPPVPKDWIAISGVVPKVTAAPDPPAVTAGESPIVNDLWTLVRAREGRSGWVLARMLMMDLPDEVAQYAERARIAAFFKVGESSDRSGASHTSWLWATAARTDSDFDCLRLFSWNPRRHRYETSYIERNLSGFLPILIDRRKSGETVEFTAVVVEKDGSLKTRVYTINGFRVRLTGRRTATLPRQWYDEKDMSTRPGGPAPLVPVQRDWRDRLPAWIPFITPRSR